MNRKYCTLHVNKWGKYKVTVKTFYKESAKTIKAVDHLNHIVAKRMLESFGVDPQEADSAIMFLEENGLNLCVFSADGRMGYTEFLGYNN